VGETADERARLYLPGSCALLRHLDHPGEVLHAALRSVGDVLRTGVADNSRGEKPVEVRVFLLHRDQAVGGEEDGPVEGLELLILVPPGAAVVPHEMAVFFEGWVVVGRQHFAVGVHIHAGTLGLLEEFFHVLEIMA